MTFARLAAIAAACAGALVPVAAKAMPPFAQAYAVDCSVCHTQVPALNAHGRYVQRSGYDPLDHAVLKRSLPLWFGANPSYDSQDPNPPPRPRFGNVAVHAAGVAGNWSYHLQQWLWQSDIPGGLDTAWISYNALLARRAHLFIGKVETPAPSPYSQWFDLANLASSAMVVGEHPYQLANNRWGSRFSFVANSVDAEIAWLGSTGDLGGTSDFASDTDKTVQWKLAWENPDRPLEIGAFGSRGSFPLSEGGTDQYRSIAGYVQRDPKRGLPGIFALYESTFDANAGNGAGAAAGNAATIELYDTFAHGRALAAIRKEYTDNPIAGALQSGNFDLEYHLARFIHVYAETYVAQGSKPGYRYMIWLTTPLSRPLR